MSETTLATSQNALLVETITATPSILGVGQNPIRVVELFAGIGSQHQALENLGIPHIIVGISEIDKYAIAGYNAMHGESVNLGDITKIEHIPECDLITYSFPCQDLSVAGCQTGMEKGSGTRSSLLWEVGRLLEDMRERDVLPEVLLMENVDAILNRKNIDQFRQWIMTLNRMGYTSSYKVLNAKDFGTPQNRKRCFMVSTLTKGEFVFPEGFPLEIRLKDVLEQDVPDSLYLSKERIEKFEEHRRRQEEEPSIIVDGNLHWKGKLEQHNRIYSPNGIAPTLCESHGGDKAPKILELSVKGGLCE